MKKRGRGKNLSNESALSEAIKNLESEIRKLSKDKVGLKQELNNASSTINFDREKEKELQEKIAKLIEKEAKLNQKKKELESKIDSVSDKMGKISKIKSEMSEI